MPLTKLMCEVHLYEYLFNFVCPLQHIIVVPVRNALL